MLRIPPADLVEPGARALRTAIGGPEPLQPAPAALIEAIARDVFAAPIDATSLEPISFDEVAHAVADPGFRRQLVGAAVALGMTVHPPDPSTATRIQELADALDVREPMVDSFARAAQGHRYWMLADYARHRWPLPGQRGSVPLLTTHHDWVHVASGYDATPIGEIQVTAFMAAQMPEDTALSVLFFGWSIYETGMLDVPLSPGAVGTIGSDPDNPRQVADALRRGSESGVDLLDLDHWAHAHRPLVEIREEFHIGPKHLPGPDATPAVPTLVTR